MYVHHFFFPHSWYFVFSMCIAYILKYCGTLTFFRCEGTRTLSQREFVNQPPIVLPLEITNCPWPISEKLNLAGRRCVLCCVMATSDDIYYIKKQQQLIQLMLWMKFMYVMNLNFRYCLYGKTFGNGRHFVCVLRAGRQWCYYDGLREYHDPGTGNQFVNKNYNPRGYIQSHCIYIQDCEWISCFLLCLFSCCRLYLRHWKTLILKEFCSSLEKHQNVDVFIIACLY